MARIIIVTAHENILESSMGLKRARPAATR